MQKSNIAKTLIIMVTFLLIGGSVRANFSFSKKEAIENTNPSFEKLSLQRKVNGGGGGGGEQEEEEEEEEDQCPASCECRSTSCPGNYYPTGDACGGGDICCCPPTGGEQEEEEEEEEEEEYVPPGGGTIPLPNPLGVGSFGELIENLVDLLFYLALVASPLMVAAGGFLITSAAGDTEKIERGKKMIWWAAIGFFIILVAKAAIGALQGILGG